MRDPNHDQGLPNHYQVLNVTPTASTRALKAAYLAAARSRHPDTGGSEGAMVELNQAWSVLSDPRRRRAYDNILFRRTKTAAKGPETGTPWIAGAAMSDQPVEAGGPRVPFDADPVDLLDDRPIGVDRSKGNAYLVLLPPALFAASVATVCVGLVINVAFVLAMAVVLFVVSCVAVLAVGMWTLRQSIRR